VSQCVLGAMRTKARASARSTRDTCTRYWLGCPMNQVLLRSTPPVVSAEQVELASQWTRGLQQTWQRISGVRASAESVEDPWDTLTLVAEAL
jgi:hypothetical protein